MPCFAQLSGLEKKNTRAAAGECTRKKGELVRCSFAIKNVKERRGEAKKKDLIRPKHSI